MRQSEFIPKRHNSEALLQQMFCNWLESRNLLFVASMMGVNLGARVGAMRKRMGCRAGIPDIIILHSRHPYNGMTIELKVKGGKSSPEQEEFQRRATLNGYYSLIMPSTMDIQDGLNWLKTKVEEYLND